MAQDGTWQARDRIPQEPEPPRVPTPTLLERVRSERDAAEQRAEQAELIVAALVRKFGECVERDHAWRVALTDTEVVELDGMLRVMLDPSSGAMLLRYERPL